jgi:hypothetical protein
MVAVMLIATASADPIALRVGAPEGLAVVAGVSESAAGWHGERLSVAAEWRVPDGAVGAGIGRTLRQPTRQTRRGDVGWDLGVAGGVLVPLRMPDLALSLTPSARRWRSWSDTEAGVALALPGVVRLTGGLEARLPIRAELTATHRLGSVSAGLIIGGGAVLSPGRGGWALEEQLGLVVTVP